MGTAAGPEATSESLRRTPGEGPCPKCEHDEVDVRGVSMSEGGPQRLVGVDGSYFTVVTCQHCGYSGFYRRSTGRNVLQYFLVTGDE